MSKLLLFISIYYFILFTSIIFIYMYIYVYFYIFYLLLFTTIIYKLLPQSRGHSVPRGAPGGNTRVSHVAEGRGKELRQEPLLGFPKKVLARQNKQAEDWLVAE